MSAEACYTIAVPIERAVTGVTISDGEHALCGYCGRSIGEGSPVGIYAYSMSDERDVTVARINCNDCATETITHPTLGGTEWLMRGTLALQSDVAHQSCQLVFVPNEGVVSMSPPTDGSNVVAEEQMEASMYCQQQ
ncbi:hypothetical protein MUK72_18005 (plasmid) [Halococcus dombrowskii]|uniref:DUF8112 domain-containing protein n=1 Tax=Halococcus dombrowskii TaxID=179637 RepID=A0AAV3SEJ8_HALDO|nr:hypothetical protein [Halococcus dombrowskii]UOO97161.1 hypothetical protein MUK72_18005 [Halococcus dombrowskii]